MLENLFWDTCVFIRYFVGDPEQPHFSDICRFVEEAKAGKRKIHFSTITMAEFTAEHFRNTDFGSVREFLEDMGSACIPIDPNPNIMIGSSELRSVTPTDPGRPHKPAKRVISTPDAIILMTCVYARDAYGISDIVLHSTDEGKGANWAGRCVPIVGFERWYPDPTRTERIDEVCSLQRSKSIHPEPQLEGIVIHGRFNTQRSNTDQPTN